MRYGGFTLKLLTLCETPLLIGGLCGVGDEARSKQDLRALSQLKLRGNTDIYDIDFMLAQAVKQCCGDYVWAVGVSAGLSDIGFYTGGIIGSPHMNATGADARPEPIGHGLSLCAFPGGPGFVAACDDPQSLICDGLGAFSPAQKAGAAVRFLHLRGINTFIVVTDGAGSGAEGSITLELDGKQTMIAFK